MKITSNSTFDKVVFKNVTLEGEIINGSEFRDCKFEGCRFIQNSFTECVFENVEVLSCTFSATKFTDSSIINIKFLKAHILGIDWTLLKNYFSQNFEFRDCDISYSNFSFLNLKKLDIISCVAKSVDFVSTSLKGSDLSHTDFDKAIFSNTDLKNANLQGATNYDINTQENKISKAKFSMPEVLRLLNNLDIEIIYD